jgi:hypothetical protein
VERIMAHALILATSLRVSKHLVSLRYFSKLE